MTRRLYLAPIVTLTLGNRSPLASKVLEYGVQPNISSVLSRNKTWCISSADFDDTQHALVAADPEITSIPFASLDNTWNDFTPAQRTAIGSRLEALAVPMDWIAVNTSVADLLRMATRVALLGQMLKADALDDVSLDSTFGSLPAARRNRILAWSAANGVDTTGLTGSTTIRAMLRALVVRYPWNVTHELPFMRSLPNGSVSAQLLIQSLREGRIGWDDPRLLNVTAQASASDNFSGTLANWTQDTGTWSIASGALTFSNAVDDNYKIRYTTTPPATNDYYVEADIVAGSGADEGWGVGARLANGTGDANTDGYCYIFYGGDASYLTELTNSTEAILDTGGAVANGATITNARLTVNGSALTGTRNGAADVSATDATYASGGWGCIYGDFSATVQGVLDNWEAADLTAATTILPQMMEHHGG